MEYRDFEREVIAGVQNQVLGVVESSVCAKNNGVSYHGVLIKRNDCNISPVIYLDEYYDRYKNGVLTIEDIINRVIYTYNENTTERSFNVESLIDWNSTKDKVLYKIVNKEKNSEMLDKVPHTEVLDLIKVFYIMIDRAEFNGNATVLVNNNIFSAWGIGLEELEEIADKNTELQLPATVRSMYDVIKGLRNSMEVEAMLISDVNMYVVTNNTGSYGAGVILYKDVLKNLADKMESDVVVIPSSVHETIVIGVDDMKSKEYLISMIREVNSTLVLSRVS